MVAIAEGFNFTNVRATVEGRCRHNGLDRYEKELANLVGCHELNKFGNKNSLIPNKPAAPKEYEAFVVDCGGSNTRVNTYQSTAAGHETFGSTPDGNRKNHGWMTPAGKAGDRPINHYFGNILDEMLVAAGGDATKIKNVGIIWSNNGEVYTLEGETRGVSLKVVGKDAGTDYRKGEPFVEGLKDGDDIGVLFIDEAKARGISLKSLVIGNDTVFVGTAAKEQPDAAGVNSSGSNMEAVINGYLTNLECGPRIKVGAALTQFENSSDLSVESLVGGGFYPPRFLQNALGYLGSDTRHSELVAALKSEAEPLLSHPSEGSIAFSQLFQVARKIYGNQRVDSATVAEFKTALGISPDTRWDAESIYALATIAYHVGQRAVKLTAVMCAIALSHGITDELLASGRPLRLAMDGRVLEGLDSDGVFATTLSSLVGKVKIELIPELPSDHGKISVPVQGAARALGHFIDLAA